MKRSLLLTLGALAGAQVASAQIIDAPVGRARGPSAYTSLSIGYLQQDEICDAASSACWGFGGGPQWRATLEAPLGRGASFGVMGSIARLPVRYRELLEQDAHANVSQIQALLRLGGGRTGLNQVVDISAGYTLFSNFRADDDGSRLGTGKMAKDFSFAVGYGLGFGFSDRMEIIFSQDYGLVFHKGTDPRQQATTRLGARVGLGG